MQRYKDTEIKDGDGNTRYYNAKVNGRRRKNRIVSLEQEEGIVEGDEKLLEYITKFYKDLFGHPEESSISLREMKMEKIDTQEREELLAAFSLTEIH